MPTDTIADTRPLSQRLKEDNWDLHERAEHDALPQHMVAGSIPREIYVELLGQMLLANAVLDDAVREQRGNVPSLDALVTDEQLQRPYLEADLRHWGVDPATPEPMPATRALMDHVAAAAAEEPLRLLGLHYVREGANNGNKFVAMKLRKAWGLGDQREGFTYLDPYGVGQRPLWERFKRDLDKQPLTEEQMATVVAAARSMFEHIIAIHRQWDLPPVERATPAHAP